MAERPQREGVMLAYHVDPGRIARLGSIFFVQPKIKGERCRVAPFHGEPVLLSSYGNEITFANHIKEAVKDVWKVWGEIPFDGEIYRDGWSQERIRSALGRSVNYNPEVTKLKYYIFDLVLGEDYRMDQQSRLIMLDNLSKKPVFDDPLLFVKPAMANFDTWRIAAQEYIDQGYEGIILRSPSAVYVPKRTVHMLKFKPSQKDVYKIVNVKEAIDKYGNPKETLGSFQVESHDGIPFYVGAGKLTWPERDRLWNSRTDLIGKNLIVKHEPITTDKGIPICAVAVEVQNEN